MVTTLKLSSHNVVQREKLENSFECTFEVSFSSKTCLVSLSFVASHFCLCSSVKAATLEKFENGMNFFWHSRLMSGWSKTFVLCKKKRRNCCKSWTNWQREILGLDVPFLDEKIIAKYLRILPSHLKAALATFPRDYYYERWEQNCCITRKHLRIFSVVSPFFDFLKLLRYSISICMNKTPICTQKNSSHTLKYLQGETDCFENDSKCLILNFYHFGIF